MTEESPGPKMKTFKTSLKNIVRHKETEEIIYRTVLTFHKAIIHALQFMKLYLLYLYNEKIEFPEIDKNFVVSVIKLIYDQSNEKSTNHGNLKEENVELNKELRKFYRKYYKETIFGDEKFDGTNMSDIFEYSADNVIVAYENNIKQHYFEYLDKFINVVYRNKELEKKELRNIKKEILETRSTSERKMKKHIKFILPKHEFVKNIYYDIHVNTQKYLPCMIYMMKYVEEKEEKLYNVFPLRSSIIPKYIKFDTRTIAQLFFKNREDINIKGVDFTKTKLIKGISKYKHDIWEKLFKLENEVFKPKNKYEVDDEYRYRYKFGYMIETDGVGCSVIFNHEKYKGKFEKGPKTKFAPEPEEIYITELDEDKKEELKNRVIVGIDPGKSDIIYCSSIIDKEHVKFRYTQNQRRKETRVKKRAELTNRLKRKKKIEGKTVQEWEAELSDFNRKTLDFDKFIDYLKKKNEINSKLMDFYANTKGKGNSTEHLFQKLRWGLFMDTQKSEQKMINSFMKKFGKPGEVVIGFGDWSQKEQMKFHEPTKNIGMRRLFRKNKYEVYLVEEQYTSQRCFACGKKEKISQCEKFLNVPNPRWNKPGYKGEELTLCNGLLQCKRKNCGVYWNRDVNGSLNIRKAARRALRSRPRPKYLCSKPG